MINFWGTKISSINGVGTIYYGRRDAGDGFIITTRWFIILFLPIIPLGSFRRYEFRNFSGDVRVSDARFKEITRLCPVPLDRRMVARTYAMAFGIVLAIIGAFSLLDHLGQ